MTYKNPTKNYNNKTLLPQGKALTFLKIQKNTLKTQRVKTQEKVRNQSSAIIK